LSRWSVRIGNSPIEMPSVAFGSTRKAVTPRCFCARSIEATTKNRPACAACEMKTLVPFEAPAAVGARRGGGHVAEVGAAAGLGEDRRR
jgi:hypothetical protein